MPHEHPPLPPEFRASDERLQEYREQVNNYLLSIQKGLQMYEKGILDKDDYAKCEQIIADKHGLSDHSVYRRRDPENSHSLE